MNVVCTGSTASPLGSVFRNLADSLRNLSVAGKTSILKGIPGGISRARG